MSKTTASEYLLEALEKAGVKRVYGVVGDSLERLHQRAAAKKVDRLDSHAS